MNLGLPTRTALFVALAVAVEMVQTRSGEAELRSAAADTAIEIEARVTLGAQSSGVPKPEISCRGQRRAEGKLTLRCLVRFDSPTEIVDATVVERTTNQIWITSFRPFERAQDDTAFFVLIDASGSGRVNTIRHCAQDLTGVFDRIHGQQRVSVATFAHDLTLLQDFTGDRASINAAFNRIEIGNSDAELYRNAADAVRRLEGISASRKILVIASPGRADDETMRRDEKEVASAARTAGVRIVSLGYAESSEEAPQLQTLDRMSKATDGISYRAPIATKVLPAEFRATILARYGSGGVLEAEAPTPDIPQQLDVTLRHSANRVTSFEANLIQPQPHALPRIDRERSDPSRWFIGIADPWWAGLIAVLVAVAAAGAAVGIARGWRSNRGLERTVSPFGSLTHRVEQSGLDEAAPRRATNDPAPTTTRQVAKETTEGAAVTVIRRAPKAEAQAPVIAWLEFNGHPGRVAVRKTQVTIGREADNDVVTDPIDDSVSRHHAVLAVNSEGRFQISNRSVEYRIDANPIYVNDQEQNQIALRDGDRVKLGTGNYGFIFREPHRVSSDEPRSSAGFTADNGPRR